MTDQTISFPARCTHCQAEMDHPAVCRSCNTLQPVDQRVDAFDLLQLPVTFRLADERLDEVYLHLTRMVHPDYFSRSPGPERSLSEDLAARINNAYRTLKDPLRRSEYLLRRAGGRSATDDKRVPPDLLGEMLDLREQVQQARDAGPAGAGALSDLARRLELRRADAFEELGHLHEELESAQAAADDARAVGLLDAVRQAVNGLRYLQGLLREIPA